jgi:hypothetical protein
MKRITVVLAALASFAVAAPTIASAYDMHRDGMHRGMMHHRGYRDVMGPRRGNHVGDVMAPRQNNHVGDVMAPTRGNHVGDVMAPSR